MTDKQGSMSLFDSNGHLIDNAFQRLIDGLLDPTESLEVSEHLSFCDQCVARYTDLLCGDFPDMGEDVFDSPLLIAPPEPVAPSVMKQLKRKAQVIYWKRIASMAVAACLALVFWVGGFFTFRTGKQPSFFLKEMAGSPQAITRETDRISDTLMDHIYGIQNSLTDLRDSLAELGRFSLFDLLPQKQAPKR